MKLKKKKQLSTAEINHRKRMFMWALLVIIINAVSLIFKGVALLQAAALFITVYALYRMVVYENKSNHDSRKYYDWAGRPLSRKKLSNKN